MCENSRKTGLLTSSGALNASSSSSAWKSDILTSFNVYDYNSRHCGLKIWKKVQFLTLKSQHSISIDSSIWFNFQQILHIVIALLFFNF